MAYSVGVSNLFAILNDEGVSGPKKQAPKKETPKSEPKKAQPEKRSEPKQAQPKQQPKAAAPKAATPKTAAPKAEEKPRTEGNKGANDKPAGEKRRNPENKSNDSGAVRDRPPREQREPREPREQREPRDRDSQAPRERRGDRDNKRGERLREGAGGVVKPVKRLHDRQSGTGRGNEFKRGGGGKGNWGKETDQEVVPTEEATEATTEKTQEKTEAAEKPQEKSEAELAKIAEEAEEAKKVTLEEYEKQLAAERPEISLVKPVRKAGEGVDQTAWEKFEKLERKDEELFKVSEKKKNAKAHDPATKKNTTLPVNIVFDKPPQRRGGDRFERNGRGGRSGNRGRGGQKKEEEVNLVLNDAKSFPSLNPKA